MILPGSYNLDIAAFTGGRFASRFTNQSQDLQYVIALEPDSSFERV
jgi:hypothetical protein